MYSESDISASLYRRFGLEDVIAALESDECSWTRCAVFLPRTESPAYVDPQEILEFLHEEFPDVEFPPTGFMVGNLPLTPIQQAMALQSMATPGSGVAIGQLVGEPEQQVDVDRLAAAWSALVASEAVLRTRLSLGPDNELRQSFETVPPRPTTVEDWSGLSNEEFETRFATLRQEQRTAGFDSNSPALIRLTILRLPEGRIRLLWTYHNAILDEHSLAPLLAKLARFYDEHRGVETAEPISPVGEFARFICRATVADRMPSSDFWRNSLKGFSEPLRLRCDLCSQGDPTPGAPLRLAVRLDREKTDHLIRFASECGVDLRTLVLGAWTLTLRHYTDTTNVVFGSARACRSTAESDHDDLIGMMVNTVPFAVPAVENETVADFLARLARLDRDIVPHETMPLDEIRRISEFAAGDRIFETLMVHNDGVPGGGITEGHALAGHYEYEGQGGLLVSLMTYVCEELVVRMDCDSSRFSESVAQELLKHFVRMLEQLACRVNAVVDEIPEPSDEQVARLLAWNETARTYDGSDATLPELFERAVDRHRERTAIVASCGSLTYGELDERANRLAHHLRSLGVGPDVPVALILERSLELMPAVYGILKAGGFFVPLDPHHPRERIESILDECSAHVVIVQNRSDVAFATDRMVLDLAGPDRPWNDCDKIRPEPIASGNGHAAYAIYTSGSTGRPKGVLVEHRAIVNHNLWMGEACRLDESCTALLKTPLTFDAVMWELFVPLESGARLLVASPDGHKSTRYLVETIREFDVTHLHFVASLLELFLDEPDVTACTSLRTVFCGGEAIGKGLQSRFAQALPAAILLNVYGPAETTVTATTWPCNVNDQGSSVPIGRPAPNVRVYVLNRSCRPKAIGLAGELYIGGVQVARGYVGRDDLTVERFLPDPFGPAGERIYRTGDVARFRSDGCLEFLGRTDFQVKVRGLRIELEEIEAVLARHPEVLQCVVVVARPTSDDPRLVAYAAPRANTRITESGLREHLSDFLPEYMLPQHFVILDKMPLSANGKIDRRALPPFEPRRTDIGEDFVKAGSVLETLLVERWRQLLGLDRIGVEDRFFELGGSSLKAIQFVAWLGDRIGEPFAIADFFAAPTVAGVIDSLEQGHATALTKCFPDHVFGTDEDLAADEAHMGMPVAGDMAIIGMAGRFPDAEDVEGFWRNLVDGVESIRFATDDELREEGIDPEEFQDEDYVRAYCSAEELDGFDAEFFGYSPREAALMDPQHRLFLELAWQALDSAGYSGAVAKGGARIGVFGGIARDAYSHNFVARHPATRDTLGDFQTAIGNDKNFPATRVAYQLDLKGPAINVQTACSTSGVALHIACQNLQMGECEIALVGGCRVLVPRRVGYTYAEGSALSSSGRLYTYDHRATGMVRGSGGAFLVIKPLEAALRDGDPIRGVIRATAINNDGGEKAGFTAPSVNGQADVVRMALRRANVDPETIGYVEGHGTATSLGDPIEVLALVRAWRSFTQKKQFSRIGSVKPNVGHLDAGAAVASIIKNVLAMERGQLPPSINYEAPNPEIDFSRSPFRVADRLEDWPRPADHPRRAAVSSFGLGGTNFHAILEEAPVRPAATDAPGSQVIVLSARSSTSLAANLGGLVAYLRQLPGISSRDLAYSLSIGRPEYEHRAFVLTAADGSLGPAQLAAAKRALAQSPGPTIRFYCPADVPQAADRLRLLMNNRADAAQVLDDCHTAADLLDDLEDGSVATFLLQLVQGRLLRRFGIQPESITGAQAAHCLSGQVEASEALSSLLASERPVVTEIVAEHSADGELEIVLGAEETLSLAVGRTWIHGATIDWEAYYGPLAPRKVPLPPFRFERRRHWLDLPNVGPRLIRLAAATNEGLDPLAQRIATALAADPQADPTDWAVNRPAGDHRLSIAVLDRTDLKSQLADPGIDRAAQRHLLVADRPTAFMFPGGGAQYLHMSRGLYERIGSFRADIDRGLALFQASTGTDLKSIWFASGHRREWAEEQLRRPSIQLPAIFILEIALANQWRSWGLEPAALIGHSLGENTAACLAGVFEYEDALGLVTLRGELFEQTEAGGMVSIPLPPEQVQPYLNESLDLGTINAPDQCTVSGREADIADLVKRLEADEIEATRIPIRTAPHSQLLDPVLDRFGEYLRSIELQPPSIPFLSNVTGGWITDEDATDPGYWVRHLRETVRFSDCVRTLGQRDAYILLETGPGMTLGSLLRAQDEAQGARTVHSLRHAQQEISDNLFLMQSIGRLLALGATLDLNRIKQDLPGCIVELDESALADRLAPQPVAATPLAAPFGMVPLSGFEPLTTPEPQKGTATMTRHEFIIQKLRGILAEMSGMEGADLANDVPFLKMGFDSLFLTQANLKIKKAFKVRTTLKQLMRESPTIDALAGVIDGQLDPDALSEEMSAQSPAPAPAATAAPSAGMPLPGPAALGAATQPIGMDLQQAIAMQIQASNALLAQLVSGVVPATGTATPAPAVVPAAPPVSPPVAVDYERNESTMPVLHGPFAPVRRATDGELTTSQQEYLNDFTARYVAKTSKSKELATEARPYYADPRTVLGFKDIYKEMTYTLVGERSKGSYVWDVDGNKYVDCQGGFGAIFFGHAPDFVVEAVRKQLDKSIDYGPQSPIAGRVARRFCEFVGQDRASFCNTGSEASLAAIRIARTVTGNDLIVMFQGSYHGIFDEVLVRSQEVRGQPRNVPIAPGIPGSASDNILMLDYDDPRSLEIIRDRQDEIAGVIVEAIQSRYCETQAFEFLRELRELTREAEIPLIFDEIITGFRIHPRGAQGWFGIDADLACYGKVVGGGMPVGVIAGKRRYMDALDGGPWQFGDDSFPEVGVTYFAGTFVRHPLALAAVDAVLDHLVEAGPQLQADMNRRTAVFAERINRRYRQMGVPIELVYFGSAFFIRYNGDPDFEFLYYHHLRYHGAYHIFGNRNCFLTTAHTDEDLDFLFDCFERAAADLQKHGFLPKPAPELASIVPFTDVQSELWLAIAQGEATAAAYNEQVMFEIDLAIDPELLELVMDKVTNRHPGLRTVPAADGSGLRPVHYMPPCFRFEDLSDLPEAEQQRRMHDLAQANIDDGFDFDNGPLLRALLMRVAPERHVICVAINHLVCDGWSLEILMEDIAGYYTGISEARFVKRRRVVGLDEIVAAEQNRRESGEPEEAREYWLKIYGDSLPPDLDLPLDRARPPVRTLAGERHAFYLDAELSERIRRAAEQEGCTAFVFLLSVYLVLLNRLSGQDDLVVGIPVAGQPSLGLTDAVTHAVSLLPLRAAVRRDERFRELLATVRDLFTDAMDQQSFAYGELLKELSIARDASRAPLLSASFNVDQAFNPIRFGDRLARFVPAPRGHAKLDLLFTLTDEGDRYLLEVDRNADVIDAATIERWVGSYRALIGGILDDPDGPVGGLPILDEEGVRRLQEWTASTAAPRRDARVVDLFEQQADRRGEHPALRCGSITLSYTELDVEANRFAHYLMNHGVRPGTLVAVAMDRSVRLPVTMLGILKAGAAYLPIDPDLPPERIAVMAEDADLHFAVVERKHAALFDGHDVELLIADEAANEIAACDEGRPGVKVSDESPAYVIFTSGSTGRPKGVEIDQGGLGNLIAALASRPGLDQEDTVLAITTVSFDPSVIEIFLPLTTGALLVLADGRDATDSSRIRELLDENAVTFMNATSTMWRLVLDTGWRPKGKFRALCGGEAMPADLAADLAGTVAELWNMYGPTEASVAVCGFRVPATGSPIRIGRSLAGAELHVLDEDGQPVPIGVTGELCIGGPGLARGYVGRPELTRERFVTARHPSLQSKRLYRTGDLVRFHADGELEFLGRNDLQVKINGLRIELGEIETVLSAHPALEKCVVTARTGADGAPALVAFIVAQAGAAPSAEELIEHARRSLPRYMVPHSYIPLNSLPLATTGKVDRKTLDRIGVEGAAVPERLIEPAAGELEESILAIWKEMLELESIGVTEDFFTLGGHSLLGIRMLARLRTELSIDIGLRDLFETSTIRELAARGRSETPSPSDPQWGAIPTRDPEAPIPASAQQARVWYLGEIEPTYLVAQYVSTALRLTGKIDIEAMQEAADQVIARHEALRTNLVMQDGELVQRIALDVRFDMTPIPLSEFGVETAEELAEWLIEESMSGPDVENDRLFRIRLVRIGPDDHVIVFTVHHLVFDGWSYDILYDEFFTVYNHRAQGLTYELKDLPVQYADFSAWQKGWLDSEPIRRQVAHWCDVLDGELVPLAMPTDFQRPPTQVHTAVELQFHFTDEQTRALDELARRYDCTMFMLVLGIYTMMLARYSGQKDFVVGSPISGRNNAAISDLIGFFVNTLVFRFRLRPQMSLAEWLTEIKQVCLDAFEHQDAPFEQIVQELNPPRDASRSPIFQTLFIYQDVRNRDIELHDLKIDNFNMERLGAQTDLDIWFKRERDSLWGGLIYPVSLFKRETAKKYVDSILNLTDSVIRDPERSVAELIAVTDEERNRIEAWSHSQRVFPAESLLQAMQRHSVERGDRPAVICEGMTVDYRGLEERSNRLARYLTARGVARGSRVGLCIERNEDLLVAVLAIWKAGAAYVPLDPDYPVLRLRSMLDAAEVEYVVTQSGLNDLTERFERTNIEVDSEAEMIGAQLSDALDTAPNGDDLAYLIFTSGSTGEPKGVMVPHRTVLNLLRSVAEWPGMKAEDRMLAITTISFDIHVVELYLPLLVGASVHLATAHDVQDAWRLMELMERYDINFLQATPGTWRSLLEAGWQGGEHMRVISTGEAFPPDLVEPLCERAVEVWNMYGPTETTVFSAGHRVSPDDPVPLIGRPVANTSLHVLDEHMQPVPPGAVGELYIGGAGLTRGYINRPDLTAATFIADPHQSGEMLYRTGDLARVREGGLFECLGRIDGQVKIRGFRIETGEIETVLNAHPSLARSAVVVVEMAPGDQRLVAWCVIQPEQEFDAGALRSHLRSRVPGYMVPQHFIALDELPLTPTGKVDRRGLAERLDEPVERTAEIGAPATETEAALHKIWADSLGLEEIGVDESFFEVGGHSLLAVKIFARIKERFGVELPLATLFETPTIGYLSERIDREVFAGRAQPTPLDSDREEFRY